MQNRFNVRIVQVTELFVFEILESGYIDAVKVFVNGFKQIYKVGKFFRDWYFNKLSHSHPILYIHPVLIESYTNNPTSDISLTKI
jgi:hypothetical protein